MLPILRYVEEYCTTAVLHVYPCLPVFTQALMYVNFSVSYSSGSGLSHVQDCHGIVGPECYSVNEITDTCSTVHVYLDSNILLPQ